MASFSLPVAVEKKKAAQLPAVQLVCEWSLHTAAILVGCYALPALAFKQYHITTPSWMSETKLTGAAAAEETAIWHRGLWCSAAQATAAALGLLLPERRRRTRRALAYAALAAAATAHLMLARVVALFLTADPGDVAWWIAGAGSVGVLVVGDINCILALLDLKRILPK